MSSVGGVQFDVFEEKDAVLESCHFQPELQAVCRSGQASPRGEQRSTQSARLRLRSHYTRTPRGSGDTAGDDRLCRRVRKLSPALWSDTNLTSFPHRTTLPTLVLVSDLVCVCVCRYIWVRVTEIYFWFPSLSGMNGPRLSDSAGEVAPGRRAAS